MEEEGSSWPIPHSLWFEKSRVISSFPNCPRHSSKPNCGPQQSGLLLPRAVFHNLPQLHFPLFLVIFSYIPEACRDFFFSFWHIVISTHHSGLIPNITVLPNSLTQVHCLTTSLSHFCAWKFPLWKHPMYLSSCIFPQWDKSKNLTCLLIRDVTVAQCYIDDLMHTQ